MVRPGVMVAGPRRRPAAGHAVGKSAGDERWCRGSGCWSAAAHRYPWQVWGRAVPWLVVPIRGVYAEERHHSPRNGSAATPLGVTAAAGVAGSAGATTRKTGKTTILLPRRQLPHLTERLHARALPLARAPRPPPRRRRSPPRGSRGRRPGQSSSPPRRCQPHFTTSHRRARPPSRPRHQPAPSPAIPHNAEVPGDDPRHHIPGRNCPGWNTFPQPEGPRAIRAFVTIPLAEIARLDAVTRDARSRAPDQAEPGGMQSGQRVAAATRMAPRSLRANPNCLGADS